MATQPDKQIALNNTAHLPPASSPQFVKGTPSWVQDMITKASQQFNIPTMVLSALLKQESGFNPNAQSPVGAQGIAQFMPGTAKGMGIDTTDPESSIMGAAQYLRHGLDKFGDIKLALAAYNAGSGAVQQYGGIPPYQETQNYVKNILSMAGEAHQSANGPYLDLLTDLKKQSQPKIGSSTSQPTQAPVQPANNMAFTPNEHTVLSGPLNNLQDPNQAPQHVGYMSPAEMNPEMPKSVPVQNTVPTAPGANSGGFNIMDAIGNMFGGNKSLVSPVPRPDLVSPLPNSYNISNNSQGNQ